MKTRGTTRPSRSAIGLLTVVLALALVACGSDGDGNGEEQSSAAAAGNTGTTAEAGQCGSIPEQMPEDPDGVIAKLPEELQQGYNTYPQPVHASRWQDWKPKGEPPYTVGVEVANAEAPLAAAMLAGTKQHAEQSELVGEIVQKTSNNNVQNQLQNVRQMIRDKVDVLIVMPLSTEAIKPVVEEAGDAGIPVVVPQGKAPTPDAVAMTANFPLMGALTAQGLTELMGQEGRVLRVHGIPGVDFDTEVFKGAEAVFKNCPEIELVGDIVGQFIPPVAKGETLKYLSSNTQPIAGVMHPAGMTMGIVEAFEQVGRDVPVMADNGVWKNSLAYWRDHRDTYKAIGSGASVAHTTDGAWSVVERMLDGRGVKVTDIVQAPPLITEENLDEWVKPEYSAQTIGSADGPEGSLFGEDLLDEFFVKPGSPQGAGQ